MYYERRATIVLRFVIFVFKIKVMIGVEGTAVADIYRPNKVGSSIVLYAFGQLIS